MDLKKLKEIPSRYSKPKRDKKTHRLGDLYYGFANQRTHFLDAIGLKASDQDPLRIDYLNTDILRHPKTHEYGSEQYFLILKVLETSDVLDKIRDTGPLKEWCAYLITHIEKLKLDTALHSLKQDILSGRFTNPKGVLLKNLYVDTAEIIKEYLYPNTPLEQRPTDKQLYKDIAQSIIKSFDTKGQISFSNPRMKYFVDKWFYVAMARKLCKLGIDFTIEKGNVIHFNINSQVSETHNLADDLLNPAIHGLITHSELRKILREYGTDHPNIDVLSYDEKNREETRKEGLGDNLAYRNKRTKEGKVNGQRK